MQLLNISKSPLVDLTRFNLILLRPRSHRTRRVALTRVDDMLGVNGALMLTLRCYAKSSIAMTGTLSVCLSLCLSH